jgi:multidrug resistance efflux pump
MKNHFALLILALLLQACGQKEEAAQQMPPPTAQQVASEVDKIVGIANIEPVGKIRPISAEVSGIVTEIYKDANQQVKKGERIMALDYKVEAAQLAQAQSKLRTQQAVIRSAQATLASQEVRLANAKTNFDRNQRLLAGGAATQQTLDDSKYQYEQYAKDAEASKATLAQQQSRLAELQADVNYNQALLDRRFVKASSDGMILSIDTKIGESVSSNTSLGDFAPAGPLMAVTEVDELFADKVKLGQAAYVRPQGGNEVLARGKVIFTSPYLKKKSLFSDGAENLEDRRVREVRVQLDSAAKVLIGSRVECVIEMK